jgi:hypothetical protein
MRAADRREITRATGGLGIPQIIDLALELSLYTRVATVNDRVAVLWGLVMPDLFGLTGHPWAMTTPVVEQNVRTFLTCSRFYVEEMLRLTPRLAVHVDESYSAALRWLRYIGFNVDQRVVVHDFPFRYARFEVA